MLKILTVASDIQGGAGKAAYRLHNSLVNNGINSKMIVALKKTNDISVIGPTSKIQKVKALVYPYIDRFFLKKYNNKSLFSTNWVPLSGIVNEINRINPDIVHLHWINNGLVSISDLKKINAPIVWSLHDMWAFTGGCHYSDKCVRFKDSCGKCPILDSNELNDLSFKIFKEKQKLFSLKKDITIVSLSKWLFELSKNSQLLKFNNHINLPNPIDTNIFKPHEKKYSRSVWNLSENKKYILF